LRAGMEPFRPCVDTLSFRKVASRMMSRRHSLHWRLPLLFSGLILVVLAGFLWSGFTQVKVALLQAGGERAQAAADQVAGLLTQQTQQRLNDSRRTAADPAVRDYLQHPTPATRLAAQT